MARVAVLLTLILIGCSRSSPSEGTTAPPPTTALQPGQSVTQAPNPPSSDPDPPQARAARQRLVRKIQADGYPWDGSGPWDERVLQAMRTVPRHLFAPALSINDAYLDRPQPIGFDQTISQPTIVAIMTNALQLTGTERVLEIGTGSGYQAAVLSGLCRALFTIEIVEPLGLAARARLRDLGYANIEVRIGDGYRGWPEQAPFDRVLLTAAPPEVPQALVDQLAEGGILVAPVGEGESQRLVRWFKRRGSLQKEDLGGVRFVPMVRGDEQ